MVILALVLEPDPGVMNFTIQVETVMEFIIIYMNLFFLPYMWELR